MTAKAYNPIDGSFTIKIDGQTGFIHPNGQERLLPCQHCLELQWRPLNTVSFLCLACWDEVTGLGKPECYDQDLEDKADIAETRDQLERDRR